MCRSCSHRLFFGAKHIVGYFVANILAASTSPLLLYLRCSEQTVLRRNYPYVIVGYGVAGKAALRGILEQDPGARVLVIDASTDEGESSQPTPQQRTALAGNSRIDNDGNSVNNKDDSVHSVFAPAEQAKPAAFSNVEFAKGAKAMSIDADRGVLIVSRVGRAGTGNVSRRVGKEEKLQGEAVGFGRCLLAFGSKPRPPPLGFVDPAVRADAALLGWRESATRENLREAVADGKMVTVVGSSWEALELSCWLQEARVVGTDKVHLFCFW